MKMGVMSFNTEYTIRADDLAVEAQARGFDSVWFPEHTHIPAGRKTPYPAGGDLPKEYCHMSDPFISCATAAACAKNIIVGTGVSLIPQHEPLAMAKCVATLDRLTNGRFEFGIGAGWNEDEMENHGVRYKERWKVLLEHLAAMKALWTEEEATFHGDYVNFDKVWSYPKPATRPHPPVIMGAFASKFGIERAAKYADGWIPVNALHENLPSDIAYLKSKLDEYGRDADSFRISIFDIEETSEDDLKRFADIDGIYRAIPRCPTEDKDTVLRWLDRYAKINEQLP
ncbi:MAG: LLM class F420-dependent oxidoreductase [Gammaproteobacteria bacterium]